MDLHFTRNTSENISLPYPLEDEYHRYIVSRILGSLFTFLIAIISIIGNVAVVIVSFRNEILRAQTGNLLIVYLSSVDIVTAFFVMIPSAIAVAIDYWPLGSVICKFHAFFNYMLSCSSSLNLTVISVDRAIAIAYPFRYRGKMTTRVMIRLCCFIFIVSFFVGSSLTFPDWISFSYSEAACAADYTAGLGIYYVFTTCCFTCYYIPITVLSVCNYIIIVAARKSSKAKPTLFVRRKNSSHLMHETIESDIHMKKTIISMIVVVVTYYVCFTPYALIKQAKVHLQIDFSAEMNYFSTVCLYVCSATNPFIYAILRKDYRDAFKSLSKSLIGNNFI